MEGDLSFTPTLEGDEEEVKEEKRMKILTPRKLLTKLPIFLAQIKAENNSYKLKRKIGQTVYLLSQHNKLAKKLCNKSSHYNNGKQYGCIKGTQNILF